MMNRFPIFASLLVLIASVSVVPGTGQANSSIGQWSLGPVFPVAPINMLVLPSGQVMFYPGDDVSGDDAHAWDPDTGTVTSLARAGYDIFCSGHSPLKDGTLLVTGGNVTTFVGLPNASLYNPVTNVWTPQPDMNAGRWYPTSTVTGLGDVLVMSGYIDTAQRENPLPQIWQPGLGAWRDLTNALLKVYNYSWVFWTPFRNAIVVGPTQATRYLDTAGTGAWTTLTNFNFPNTRDYGSAVMYTPWRIMIAGGGQPPTNTAEILNLSEANPTWQYTSPMAFPRRHLNLTLLPDDNVLATGGTSADGFNNTSQPVYAAEMWNIHTRTWTTMASQTIGRFYHSMAMLLPDGRVLSAGGNFTYQTEIYSPPYLFNGPRPTITSAPASTVYAETVFVGTPDAAKIFNVRLIRLPAVTHAFDQNQRILQLSFTKTTDGLNVVMPSDQAKAPPGHYMLFILNNNDVPSVAKIIQVVQ